MPFLMCIQTYGVRKQEQRLAGFISHMVQQVAAQLAERFQQFGFTFFPDDNGGKKRLLLLCSKHLAKRAGMLTHWKAALENVRGLQLFQWETRNFTNSGQLNHTALQSYHLRSVSPNGCNCGVILCLIFTMSKAFNE